MPVLDLPSHFISDDALLGLPSVVFALLQDVDDNEYLSAIANDDLANRDFLYCVGIMCAPDEPDEAIALNNELVSDELYDAMCLIEENGLNGSTSTGTTLAIANRQCPIGIIEGLLHRQWLAHIACGHILRRVVSLSQNLATKETASLAEAAAMVETWCKNSRIVGGTRYNVTRNLWPKYKSVSHLWGAFSIMTDVQAHQKMTMPQFMMFFLGTAQWLLEQGLIITPKGRTLGQHFLTVEDMWSIPSRSMPRSADGSPFYRIWNDCPGAHDIRKRGAPPRPKHDQP
jgi:hypothetical protein